MTYEELRRRLRIDYLRLDEELVEMPQLLQDASENATQLSNEFARADMALDIIRAETTMKLRSELTENGRAPSEARIASQIDLEPTVQEARALVNELKMQVRLATDLFNNLHTKSRLLGKAADMLLNGYVAPNKALSMDYRESRRQLKRPETK
jgi:hypothetical protein